MIDYEEDAVFSVLLRIAGSIWIRAALYALFPALLTVGIIYWEDQYPETVSDIGGFANWDKSHVWTGSVTVLSALVVFRTQQAFSRFWEGTGLLHQMKGEWFDTVSNVVCFTISAKTKFPEEVMNFRGVIVRLMSLVHASALEEISTSGAQLPTIDVYGLDMGTLRYLKECVEVYDFNKVEAILHLLQSLITVGQETGLITVPPPILSRVYQTMSRGYVNLLNTKKITDTKFPFPFVQIISLLILFMTVMTPIIFSTTLAHYVWAPLCTFLPMFGIHALNFVAMELENPFGIDPNDLPLETFQKEMNQCLLLLLHPKSDSLPGLSGLAVSDFRELYERTQVAEPSKDSSRFSTTRLAQATTSMPILRGAFSKLKLLHSSSRITKETSEEGSERSLAPSHKKSRDTLVSDSESNLASHSRHEVGSPSASSIQFALSETRIKLADRKSSTSASSESSSTRNGSTQNNTKPHEGAAGALNNSSNNNIINSTSNSNNNNNNMHASTSNGSHRAGPVGKITSDSSQGQGNGLGKSSQLADKVSLDGSPPSTPQPAPALRRTGGPVKSIEPPSLPALDSELFQRTLVAWIENMDSIFGELGRSLDMLGTNAKVAGTAGRNVGRMMRASPVFSTAATSSSKEDANGVPPPLVSPGIEREFKTLQVPAPIPFGDDRKSSPPSLPLDDGQKSLPTSFSLPAVDPPAWESPDTMRELCSERSRLMDDDEDIENSAFFAANVLHRVATTSKPEAGCASASSGLGREYI